MVLSMVAIASIPEKIEYEVEDPDVSGLVTEDDAPMDNIFSEKQQRLLTEPLYSSWMGPPALEDGKPRRFAALANVGLFPSPDEPPSVPDMMLSLDVTLPADFSEKKNRSYFVWRFAKAPELVIELVSNREGDELGARFRRYRKMRISYYVVYDPLHELGETSLRTFELRGDLYVAIERPWFESVGLGLVEWDGVFEGMQARWLRWRTSDGTLVPTGAERAEAEKARAEAEKARAERLLAKLRAAGIDPNGDG
jgi:Uma2 family endonuclease